MHQNSYSELSKEMPEADMCPKKSSTHANSMLTVEKGFTLRQKETFKGRKARKYRFTRIHALIAFALFAVISEPCTPISTTFTKSMNPIRY